MADRYRTQAEDTSVDVERLQFAIYAKMTPADKLRILAAMRRMVLRLQRANILSERPQADEFEIRMRIASRTLARETMIAAYGWDPALHDD